MKKWAPIYLAWGLGILSVIGVAYWYYSQSLGSPPQDQQPPEETE